jgi:hypothetical protein
MRIFFTLSLRTISRSNNSHHTWSVNIQILTSTLSSQTLPEFEKTARRKPASCGGILFLLQIYFLHESLFLQAYLLYDSYPRKDGRPTITVTPPLFHPGDLSFQLYELLTLLSPCNTPETERVLFALGQFRARSRGSTFPPLLSDRSD